LKVSPNSSRKIRSATETLAVIERLAAFPRSGRVVPEVADERIREIIHGHYRIVYKTLNNDVVILTIIHGARLLPPSAIK
jgi:plasmid stabilization system protein ParE